MGTNYYYNPNPCPTCGHGDEIHIGKSSAGWTFSFHGTEAIRSYTDWITVFLSGGKITDEYDREKTVVEFRQMVSNKSGAKRNHAKEFPDDCWLDDDGNGFSASDFS